ncbi:MAG: VanZ family protein [Anaerolineae bacterium]|nr:VanZ family protein [Anaerolineae bacterium]
MKAVRWLTAVYSVFLIGIVLIADLGIGGRLQDVMDNLPGGDKTGHFFLMGFLSFLLNLSLVAERKPVGSFSVLKGSMIVAGVVFLEECTQVFLSARGFSLLDLVADTIGIALFGEIAAWMITHRHARYSGKSGGIGGGMA